MIKKISIVTGGASGLGYEISKKLILNNINVCIIGRDKNKLQEVEKQLKVLNNKLDVITISANIGREEDVKKVFTQLSSYTINRIFNIAGVGRFGAPEKITSDVIDTVFEANLKGLILMSSYGLRHMNDEENFIINIMSTAALLGRSQESVYCAAKWGARGFTEALKAATKGTKFKVISVYPGGMKTPFWSKDCGMDTDTEKFMAPADVADRIMSNLFNTDSCMVTDITINRR